MDGHRGGGVRATVGVRASHVKLGAGCKVIR